MQQSISSQNLSEYTIKQLSNLGFNYNNDLTIVDRNSVQNIISSNELLRITKVPPTTTALELCQEECLLQNIKTLCKSIDRVFGLGIPVKHITEFCGEPGTGKTQLCLQLCINVQLPQCCGGLQSKSIYISTKNGFVRSRVKEMAENILHFTSLFHSKHATNANQSEFHIENILDGIHFCKVDNYIELIAIAKRLPAIVLKENIRLIVIDSICAPLKYISDRRERLSVINSLLMELQSLGDRYNLAIVITNDFTTRIRLPEKVPCLGDSYFHRLNQRFLFNRKSQDKFKVTAIKSIRRGPESCEFFISNFITDL